MGWEASEIGLARLFCGMKTIAPARTVRFFRPFGSRNCRRTLLVLAAAGLAAGAASGQTITVNWSQDDWVDFGGQQQVSDLPGPDGHLTFSEAVFAANNTPGPQTIAFAVPRADWWTLFGNDVCYFRHELMNYVSGDDTTIDFTTQTAFTGDTNPNGNEVAFYYAGATSSIPNIWLAGNRITLKGVDRLLGNNAGQGLWISGNDCRVLGCTTTGLTIRGDYGGGARNIIGGTGPGEGNVFSGATNIRSGANENIVIGNIFRYGMRIVGDRLYGTCNDNRIGGPTLAERNVFSGHGFGGEEGMPLGSEIEVYTSMNTRIEGNWVGTSDDGLAGGARVGVIGIGVGIGALDTLVTGNTVGGIVRVGSGHNQGLRFGVGIQVSATANRTRIVGNRVGVGVDGVSLIPNVYGISVQWDINGTPTNTTVEDNTVASSEQSGVRVLNTALARISRNAIFDNGGLGIDLGTAGVALNDVRDGDSGANSLQNYPVLIAANVAGGMLRVTGTLDSTPARVFVVEFFASPSCDPSGFGEGARFLGSTQVQTDASGLAAIDASLAEDLLAGTVVTATATETVTGNTSEFSACRVVEAAACSADFNGDGFVDFFDYDAFVGCFESGACPPGASADFNADGFVDFFDYDAFVIAFEAGC